MHTAHFTDSRGSPYMDPTPPTEPLLGRDPPGRNMGPGTEIPLEGTWNQIVR